MITSFSSLLLPPWAEKRVTDIQFYFVVLIDIFYYGCAFGVRVDGPLARGFLRFLSLTAFQAEGCGIALSGDEYKVSVTGFTFSVIWHDKHSADWLAALASPYPASPDFSTGKRVTRFSGRFASLRIVFRKCQVFLGNSFDCR